MPTRRKAAPKAAPPPKARRKAAPPPAPPAPPAEEQEPLAGLFSLEGLTVEQRVALMLSPEGSELMTPEDVLATTEQAWIRAQGWTPLEFLAHAYRNPYLRAQDRITAAKSLLDYVHKRLPQSMALGADPTLPALMPAGSGRMNLSQLNDEELALLAKLMSKANHNPDSKDKP